MPEPQGWTLVQPAPSSAPGWTPVSAAPEQVVDPETVEGSPSARFLSNAAEVLNPVTAVKGIAQAVRHPIRTATGIATAHAAQFGKAREAFGRGDALSLMEGVGHGAAALLPVIGPAAAEAGEQIASGDVAGGLGRGVGLVTGAGLAGPAARVPARVLRPVAQRSARALYQSALKPTKSVLKDVRVPRGAGPDAARQTLVETGLRERIPISSAGAKKVESLIDSLNEKVQAKLDEATSAGKTIDPSAVEREIAAVAKDFTDQVNAQPDLAAIETVKQNFRTNPNIEQPIYPVESEAAALQRHLQAGGSPKSFSPPKPEMAPGPVPVATAQRMKTNTYKGLRGKYGVERGATIEAEKAGARGLKEQIEVQAPEVAADNARVGSVIPLEEAIADAMRRRGNYGIFGLTPVVASIPAVTQGNYWPLLASMADRMPGAMSSAAIRLYGAGKGTGKATQRAARATAVGNQNEVWLTIRPPATAEETRERTPGAQGRR